MRILFTAPRYHTNQIPIVSGLQKKGHDVAYFVVQYGATEDHSLIKPILLKPSKGTISEKKRLERKKMPSEVESILNGHFVPDMPYLKEQFIKFNPEIVICREKTPLTLCVNWLCNKYKVPCVLYDQEPIYKLMNDNPEKKDKIQNQSILKQYYNRFAIKLNRLFNADQRLLAKLKAETGFPIVHMTPVMYRKLPRSLSSTTKKEKDYFIPFVAPEMNSFPKTEHKGIRILSVGKFREHKNFPMFLEAISSLGDLDISVTIVGQAVSSDEISYMNMIKEMISSMSLSDRIEIKPNVPYQDMAKIYHAHDLFILTTRREFASISVLEAMACGLAVISTNYNGTASYIDEGKSGYVFETGNSGDLAGKIRMACANNVQMMGRIAEKSIKEKYSFEAYYKGLVGMFNSEFPGVINV